MSNKQETLDSLAAKVGELTNAVTSYLRSEGLPPLSFAADSDAQYPVAKELTEPRLKLIGVLSDMLHLARGGRDFIFLECVTVCKCAQK